jgi:RNA polymerase sigma-70 factor (ECF subfamily)
MNTPISSESVQGGSPRFQATQWTRIAAASGSSSSEAKEALNQLCQTYWFPLYAFIRGKGLDSHKAQDLTQGFFLHLLESDLIKKADPRQGRFRSFLLTSLIHFLEDERRREQAKKRGGAVTIVSIDETEAEQKYGLLPAHEPATAKAFDGTWAATVIDQVHGKLRESYANRARLEVYESLKQCLTGALLPDSYTEVAAKLGMTRETFEVNLTRFRAAFGESIRAVIGQTVADPDEIDDEIKYLMAAWAGHLEVNHATD